MSAQALAELAREAEEAGWDGVFPLKTGGITRKKDLQEIMAFI
jgi:hypothetical protein